MCGIVGYIGNNEAYSIVIKGLKRLEYRGYDSAGIALMGDNEIKVFKKQGKVANLEEFAEIKILLVQLPLDIRDGLHMEPQMM